MWWWTLYSRYFIVGSYLMIQVYRPKDQCPPPPLFLNRMSTLTILERKNGYLEVGDNATYKPKYGRKDGCTLFPRKTLYCVLYLK